MKGEPLYSLPSQLSAACRAHSRVAAVAKAAAQGRDKKKRCQQHRMFARAFQACGAALHNPTLPILVHFFPPNIVTVPPPCYPGLFSLHPVQWQPATCCYWCGVLRCQHPAPTYPNSRLVPRSQAHLPVYRSLRSRPLLAAALAALRYAARTATHSRHARASTQPPITRSGWNVRAVPSMLPLLPVQLAE